MMPAICPAAEFAAGFLSAALLGAAASVAELGPAAGFGALLAKLGSCFASDDWTALHLLHDTSLSSVRTRCYLLDTGLVCTTF